MMSEESNEYLGNAKVVVAAALWRSNARRERMESYRFYCMLPYRVSESLSRQPTKCLDQNLEQNRLETDVVVESVDFGSLGPTCSPAVRIKIATCKGGDVVAQGSGN
jgi:hypothetical protein